MPTVGQVVAVVDAQLGSGLLRCLEPGCGGRLARWGLGVERDLVGPGGVTGRVRPRRALCAGCGVSRVLLPDSMLRRRQYGVEVIWAGLLAAARGRPWNQVAAELGVPYTTVREWLRRFAPAGGPGACVGCAGCCRGWWMTRCGRMGTASAAGDALAVLGALHQQMPGRWPVVGRVVAGAAGGAAVEVRAAGPVLAARGGQHEFAGDITRWQAPP